MSSLVSQEEAQKTIINNIANKKIDSQLMFFYILLARYAQGIIPKEVMSGIWLIVDDTLKYNKVHALTFPIVYYTLYPPTEKIYDDFMTLFRNYKILGFRNSLIMLNILASDLANKVATRIYRIVSEATISQVLIFLLFMIWLRLIF